MAAGFLLILDIGSVEGLSRCCKVHVVVVCGPPSHDSVEYNRSDCCTRQQGYLKGRGDKLLYFVITHAWVEPTHTRLDIYLPELCVDF